MLPVLPDGEMSDEGLPSEELPPDYELLDEALADVDALTAVALAEPALKLVWRPDHVDA